MIVEKDRRAYSRYFKNLPITYVNLESGHQFEGKMHNTSMNGMCFTSKEEIGLGTNLCVKMEHFSPDIYNADLSRGSHAEVIWCQRMGKKSDSDIPGYEIGVRHQELLI